MTRGRADVDHRFYRVLLLERAFILCEPGEWMTEYELFDRMPFGDGPPAKSADAGDATLRDAVVRFECERIAELLRQCDGNKTHAARRLGITYKGC